MRAIDALQIHTEDQTATSDFFRSVLGWEFEPFAPMPWTSRAHVDGTILGLAPVHEMNGPGDVMLGVRSSDLDADVARALGAGGRILVEPSPSPEGGRFAICEAPGGSKILFYDETARR